MQIDKGAAERKLEELIVYISGKCSEHDLFGAIKLNKILFFSDFLYYQFAGKSITNADYQKLEFGPAPRRMKPILAKLETDESLVIWPKPVLVNGARRIQKRPTARRKADLSVFCAEEIEFVDLVITQLEHETAKEVSDLTHRHLGWRLAGVGDSIPYAAAFLGTGSDRLSESDLAAGKKLAKALQ